MDKRKEFIQSTKEDICSLFSDAMKKKNEWTFCYFDSYNNYYFNARYKKKVGTRFFGLFPKYLTLRISNKKAKLSVQDDLVFYVNNEIIILDFFDKTFNEKDIYIFLLELYNESILKRDFKIAKKIKDNTT